MRALRTLRACKTLNTTWASFPPQLLFTCVSFLTFSPFISSYHCLAVAFCTLQTCQPLHACWTVDTVRYLGSLCPLQAWLTFWSRWSLWSSRSNRPCKSVSFFRASRKSVYITHAYISSSEFFFINFFGLSVVQSSSLWSTPTSSAIRLFSLGRKLKMQNGSTCLECFWAPCTRSEWDRWNCSFCAVCWNNWWHKLDHKRWQFFGCLSEALWVEWFPLPCFHDLVNNNKIEAFGKVLQKSLTFVLV